MNVQPGLRVLLQRQGPPSRPSTADAGPQLTQARAGRAPVPGPRSPVPGPQARTVAGTTRPQRDLTVLQGLPEAPNTRAHPLPQHRSPAREQNPLSEGPLSCHLCSRAAGLPAWLLAPPPAPQLHRQGHLYANPTDTGEGGLRNPTCTRCRGGGRPQGSPGDLG